MCVRIVVVIVVVIVAVVEAILVNDKSSYSETCL